MPVAYNSQHKEGNNQEITKCYANSKFSGSFIGDGLHEGRLWRLTRPQQNSKMRQIYTWGMIDVLRKGFKLFH